MRNYPDYRLLLHDDAELDLESLWMEDEESAAVIEAFLEEVADSQDLLERFLSEFHADHLHDPGFDIKRWKALWKEYPAWRIRLFNVPKGAANRRIIYTFHPKEQCCYVLGIIPRGFDYDPKHPLSRRILRALDELGIS
jgi:hypothetical protein